MGKLNLFDFVPFRLNRLSAEMSGALASVYQQQYGIDIPSWRVIATLGYRDCSCTAQYIVQCTRTHKSSISRAIAALTERNLVERVTNDDDRREQALRLSASGKKVYAALVPKLLNREREILACLSAEERKTLASLLTKLERKLDLAQDSAA